MTLSITFYDNIKYHRQDFINRDLDFFGNGVVTTTEFPTSFPSTPNLSVNIGQGRAWVDGYRIYNDSNLVNLTLQASDPTNPRIDIVEIGHNDLNSLPSLQIKTGVAAASPVEPGADAGYIKLYAINVPANATSISSSNIIDRRTLVPLNVTGSQIQYSGAAGTNQANTFSAGYIQTFNGPIASNGGLSTNHGGKTDLYGPLTVHGGVGLTVNVLAVPGGFTVANATSGTVGANIAANTTYSYELTAVSYAGTETNASAAVSVTTGATAYPINLSWTAASADTQYINVYKNGDFLVQVAGTATTYQDAGSVATTTQVPPSTNQTGIITGNGSGLTNLPISPPPVIAWFIR